MSDMDIRKKAKLRAIHLLEYSDRTEQGLRQKLAEDYLDEVIDETLAYVKSFGYIDDTRYAENYIRSRMLQKSRRQLFAELARKGIARETADAAWASVSEEQKPDERAILRALIRRKYSDGDRLDEREMRRLQGYLARRGFSFGDIFAVLEEMDLVVLRGSCET